MADNAPKGKIPVHPVLKKLTDKGITGVTSLQGFVGPSNTPGNIRLYPSLEDLSESIEIAEADIVHYENIAETVIAGGAVSVWLRKGAEVTQKVSRVQTTAGAREALKQGRLVIKVPGPGGITSEVCQSVCDVCQSVCDVCQSVCGVCSSSIGRVGNLGRVGNINRLGKVGNIGKLAGRALKGRR